MRTNLLYCVILCALGMMLGACTEKDNVGVTTTDSLLVEPNDTIPRPTEGEWIDLGLPSGLLWASCNLGANTPTEYGNYYAWGETQPKSSYNNSNHIYYQRYESGIWVYIKYNPSDSLTTLEPMDDAATANLGNGARTPTKAEWEELYHNCTIKYIWYENRNNDDDNNPYSYIHGHFFTGPNGNSIFLPSAGYRKGNGYGDCCNYSYYWSASCGNLVEYPLYYIPYFFLARVDLYHQHRTTYAKSSPNRACGLSVRAVRPQ